MVLPCVGAVVVGAGVGGLDVVAAVGACVVLAAVGAAVGLDVVAMVGAFVVGVGCPTAQLRAIAQVASVVFLEFPADFVSE